MYQNTKNEKIDFKIVYTKNRCNFVKLKYCEIKYDYFKPLENSDKNGLFWGENKGVQKHVFWRIKDGR